MMIRSFAFVLFLSACSGLPDVVVDNVVGQSTQAPPVGRYAQLAQNPTVPVLQLGVETAGTAGIVLRDVSRNGYESWLSQDGATFATQSGLLIATRGLGGDLMSSDIAAVSDLIKSRQPGRATRFHSFLNGNNRTVMRSYVCDVSSRGARDLELNTGVFATTLLAEDCRSVDQQFTNLYWVDQAGQVLQSRQWAGPMIGPIALRTVFR